MTPQQKYQRSEKGLEWRRRWRKKRYLWQTQIIIEAKKKPCADCGKSYPYYVMDFDHIKGDKKFSVCQQKGRSGRASILAEIAKCEVVCSNCHRERTHSRKCKTGEWAA